MYSDLEKSYDDFFNQIKSGNLPIYANNFRISNLNFFKEVFPICEKIIGENSFAAIVCEYSKCKRGGIDWLDFSRDFPKKLSQFQLPYLFDVANLELAQYQSYFSKACDLDNFSKLSEISENDWPNIKLYIHPGLHFFNVQYPVIEICDWNQSAINSELVIDLEPKLRNVFVFRSWNGDFSRGYLADSDLSFLVSIKQGMRLGEIHFKPELIGNIYKKSWLSHWSL